MTYSRNKEGAFWKMCVLFEPKVGGSSEEQKFGLSKKISMVKFKDAL